MPRPRNLSSEPIYTRLPDEAMNYFEELREEYGLSRSEFARQLILNRLAELKIQKEAAMSLLAESGKTGSEAGRQARMALESDLEGEDADRIE
jgi:type IV secretory pathway VirD2 relaxase